jgi:hypothetical protein
VEYRKFLDYSIERRVAKVTFVNAIKAYRGCKCGVKDPRCLQFDHRDPNSKLKGISTLVGGGWSLKRVLEEVEKCDVICANCHMIKHYEDKAMNRNQKPSKHRL